MVLARRVALASRGLALAASRRPSSTLLSSCILSPGGQKQQPKGKHTTPGTTGRNKAALAGAWRTSAGVFRGACVVPPVKRGLSREGHVVGESAEGRRAFFGGGEATVHEERRLINHSPEDLFDVVAPRPRPHPPPPPQTSQSSRGSPSPRHSSTPSPCPPRIIFFALVPVNFSRIEHPSNLRLHR